MKRTENTIRLLVLTAADTHSKQANQQKAFLIIYCRVQLKIWFLSLEVLRIFYKKGRKGDEVPDSEWKKICSLK